MATRPKRSTTPSASRRTRRRTRSRRRTASSPASTTRTRTRATRRRRSASRRCRARTTCSPTRRSASSTTPSARPTAAARGRATSTSARVRTSTSATCATSSAGFGDVFGGGGARQQQRPTAAPTSRPWSGCPSRTRSAGSRPGSRSRSRPPAASAAAPAPSRRLAARGLPRVQGARGDRREPGLLRHLAAVPRGAAGKATIVENPCPRCHGSGRERRTKQLHGEDSCRRQGRHADPAQGQGRARLQRRPAGDLYVVTRVADSPLYERRGADLVSTCPSRSPTQRSAPRSRCRPPRARSR